jgi:hypothetical protein
MYVFSNCIYYIHNIFNFLCKNYFEHHIDQSISKLSVTYFYCTKVIEILYSTYHKPNGSLHGFVFLLTKFFYLFFYEYVKNCFNHKLDFQ